jgi:hypothetical protein
VTSLKEALEAIPARRDKLNALDDRLAKVIQHIETVLHEGLKISVPCDIKYVTEDGAFFLGYGKWKGKWGCIWGREDDDDTKDTPLLGAPRAVRAEVFMVEPDSGMSPMERLLIEAAESLSYYADERAPQLETANRLLVTLAEAGFPPVS